MKPMTSLNISLPKTLKKFVEDQTAEGGYSTPSEYVRQLLRDDQKRRAEEELETLILEGLNSGEPIAVTPEFWAAKRRRILERHAQRTRKSK